MISFESLYCHTKWTICDFSFIGILLACCLKKDLLAFEVDLSEQEENQPTE